jgi:hypothetical protein
VKLRTVRLLAAAAGLAMGATAFAAEPAKLPAVKASAKTPAGNQALADTIAAKLTATGSAHLADVSLSVTDGIVTVIGTCKDAGTKEKVINDIRMVSGVSKVRDGLNVGVQQAQATQPMTLPPAIGPVVSPAMTGMMPPMNTGPMVEPTAMGAFNGMGSADLHAPPLPPNAWPTYAPHNNVSRVAYPNAYPHNAFPFIGPYYPFPKVPLGWRKVTLEWEDGHWWYGRLQTPNDYWRVRFW